LHFGDQQQNQAAKPEIRSKSRNHLERIAKKANRKGEIEQDRYHGFKMALMTLKKPISGMTSEC